MPTINLQAGCWTQVSNRNDQTVFACQTSTVAGKKTEKGDVVFTTSFRHIPVRKVRQNFNIATVDSHGTAKYTANRSIELGEELCCNDPAAYTIRSFWAKPKPVRPAPYLAFEVMKV